VNSVTRALHLASQKKSNIAGSMFRIFKAGTSTKVFLDKTIKPKTRDVRGSGARGRGRGGRAGRARGGRNRR